MRQLFAVILVCICLAGCAGLKVVKKDEIPVVVAEKPRLTMNKDLLAVYLEADDVAGGELRNLAIGNGIIPQDADYEYFRTHRKAHNAVAIWIVQSKQEKISAIDAYKRIFKLRGAVVSNPSEQYVSMINGVLYKRINRAEFDIAKQNGIVNIFKTLAIFEGDYNDGRNKAVILRQWIGEDGFEWFKKKYPEQYRKLQGVS